MPPKSSEQNEENQFILNFDEGLITLSKNNQQSFGTAEILGHLTKDQIQKNLIHNNLASPKDILEESRIKVLHSRSLKSLLDTQFQIESRLKKQSLSKLRAKKQAADKILNDRFSQYQQKLSKSINKLQSICHEHFGGVQTVNQKLTKHELTKQELAQYYAKIVPKNIEILQKSSLNRRKSSQFQKLPQLRSHSQKKIIFFNQSKDKKEKKQTKLNKWYIQPQKRFSTKKDNTTYDWKTQEGFKNVLRTEQLKIKSKQIASLIKQVKEKFHRQPLFCKYVKIS